MGLVTRVCAKGTQRDTRIRFHRKSQRRGTPPWRRTNTHSIVHAKKTRCAREHRNAPECTRSAQASARTRLARAREERPVLSTSKGPHTVQAKTTEPLHCFPNAGRTIKNCQYEGLASKLMHQNRNDAQNCCIAPSFGKRWDNVDGYLYKCGVSLLGAAPAAGPTSDLYTLVYASATLALYASLGDDTNVSQLQRQNNSASKLL